MSKAKKSKSGSKLGKADAATEQGAICDGCCTSIEDNEHEAIQCEGSCQKWYHRLCAGVSKYHYDKLADSPSPFICWLCSDSLQKAVIRELQQELSALKQDFTVKLDANHSAIAALKEENAALKTALGQSNSSQQPSLDAPTPAGRGNDWTRVHHADGRSRNKDLERHRRRLLRNRRLSLKAKKIHLKAILINPLPGKTVLQLLEREKFGVPTLVLPLVLCRRPLLLSPNWPIPVLPSKESSE